MKMDEQRCFQEALRKAFAAQNPKARMAYFDLASFYHRRLEGTAHLHPSADLLREMVKPKGETPEAP